jgi:hypothetical protein
LVHAGEPDRIAVAEIRLGGRVDRLGLRDAQQRAERPDDSRLAVDQHRIARGIALFDQHLRHRHVAARREPHRALQRLELKKRLFARARALRLRGEIAAHRLRPKIEHRVVGESAR